MIHTITIHKEIDTAHRVVGHPGKCRYLHGHRWQFDITIASDTLDETGFVCDFGVVKAIINQWDHRLLLWVDDPITIGQDPAAEPWILGEPDLGVIRVSANPTSENLGRLMHEALTLELPMHVAIAVRVSETPSTSSTYRGARME